MPVGQQIEMQVHMHGPGPQVSQTSMASQYALAPEVIMAIVAAIGLSGANPTQPEKAQLPTRKYFFHAIRNATSDLPIPVIKELKARFKNYIPLALCTHKACLNTMCSTDTIDTKIAWNDKGEMRLKQKAMMAGKDYHLTTNDSMEIHENCIHRMCKYLIMGEDVESGGD